jgi:23S rRNA (cytosine1962-C5)-methyltransferase
MKRSEQEEVPGRRRLELKGGRDRSVRNRHPWVFTGAIARASGPSDAAVAEIYSSSGEKLGSGFFSERSQIAARLLTFGESDLTPEVVHQRIVRAIRRRDSVIDPSRTTALRLVHSEGDEISGLIVDRYADVVVVEITSAGLEQWKETVVATLREAVSPRIIYFKNNLPARKLEGLTLEDEVTGEGSDRVVVKENGLLFEVAPTMAQKTGFFLDQRDNRALVGELAGGRSVLNLFSYTGGFGVYAAAGGATEVEEVDISAPAIAQAEVNHRLNGSAAKCTVADVFQYSRELVASRQQRELIICDPPAFARSKGEVDRAARGYKDVNLQALKLAPDAGLVATFSCSGHISLDLFQKIVYSAALDAGRRVSFIRRLSAGADHPVSLFCPEGEYLKGFLLRVHD